MRKIIILLISFILILASCGSDPSSVSRSRPETYELTETYILPASAEQTAEDYYYEVDGRVDGLTVVCGEDIPLGQYTIEFDAGNSADLAIMSYQATGVDSSEPAGDSINLSNGETFTCEEGYEVNVRGDTGPLTLSRLAQPATEEKEVTEKVIYKYDGDKDGDNQDDNQELSEEDYVALCYSNDVEIPCDNLHSNTLYDDTISLYNRRQF